MGGPVSASDAVSRLVVDLVYIYSQWDDENDNERLVEISKAQVAENAERRIDKFAKEFNLSPEWAKQAKESLALNFSEAESIDDMVEEEVVDALAQASADLPSVTADLETVKNNVFSYDVSPELEEKGYEGIDIAGKEYIEASLGGMAGLVHHVQEQMPDEGAVPDNSSLSLEGKIIDYFIKRVVEEGNNPKSHPENLRQMVHDFSKTYHLGKSFENYFLAGVQGARRDGFLSPDEVTACLCDAGRHINKGLKQILRSAVSGNPEENSPDAAARNFLEYRDKAVKGESDLREQLAQENPAYEAGVVRLINKMM